MPPENSSRRSFLVASGALGGAALAAGCSHGYGDAHAAPDADYVTVAQAGPQGTAPNARTHPLSDGDYFLVLRQGDELFTALNDFAVANRVQSAGFTAIGSLIDVRLGWFDDGRKEFKVSSIPGQVEAASITGDIGTYQDEPAVHTHLVVGGPEAQTWGGHLLHAVTSPTVEVFIRTHPVTLTKSVDPATSLILFD